MRTRDHRAPLVLLDGDDDAARAVADELEAEGWSGVVDVVVRDAEDAAAVVLAVLDGAPAVIRTAADADLVDRLCEDLRRVGPLQLRSGAQPGPLLDTTDHRLVELLGNGLPRRDAAAALHMSVRSFDRRLAGIRARLGVESTAEVLRRMRP